MKQHKDINVILVIDGIDEELEAVVGEKFVVETQVEVLMNFDSEGHEDYKEIVNALYGKGSYRFAPR